MSNNNNKPVIKCVKPSEPDPEELYQRFMGCHNHDNDDLFSRNTVNTEGVWHVFGDDPNCDLGGPHHTPDLGYFEGRLEDVIRHAVMLPKFWAWGPGRIVKEGPPLMTKIDRDAAKRIAEARERLDKLDAEREELLGLLGRWSGGRDRR